MKRLVVTAGENHLNASLFLPEVLRANNPTILFIHGWTSAKERSYQYATHLTSLGYISFLFDMRGHGGSEGDLNTATTKEFLDDTATVYDYVLTIKGVDKGNISVVGSSFGSYLAILLSAMRPIKRLALRVPADYANEFFNRSKMETTGITTPEVLEWRFKPKGVHETFALEAISKFNGDILIIESGKDTIVPHQTTQNYINAIQDKQKLTHKIIQNAPHSIKEGPFRDKVEDILVNWFQTYI